MDTLAEAVLSGAPPEELSGLPLPEHFLAAHLRASDVGIFDGETDKDVRRSLHIGPVPMPRLAPDEVVVAVAATGFTSRRLGQGHARPMSGSKTVARHSTCSARVSRY